jgi:DNA-directed RNA polymerase subunit RPC12/RpoP
MPIKFRCAYCNQLMGIARRKAGTVVSCPTCGGQVVVPTPEPPIQPVQLPPQPGNGPPVNVFEKPDFDAGMFNPNPIAGQTSAAAPMHQPLMHATVPAPAPIPMAGSDINAVALSMPEERRAPHGLVLTPAKMFLLGLVVLLLMGLAFAAGFFCAGAF